MIKQTSIDELYSKIVAIDYLLDLYSNELEIYRGYNPDTIEYNMFNEIILKQSSLTIKKEELIKEMENRIISD